MARIRGRLRIGEHGERREATITTEIVNWPVGRTHQKHVVISMTTDSERGNPTILVLRHDDADKLLAQIQNALARS